MFHLANKQHRNYVILALALIVGYGFRTTRIYDSYWGEWYTATTDIYSRLAYFAIFLVLVARAKYVREAFMTVSTVWLVADFVPNSFDYWTKGGLTEFVITVLYIAGGALFIRVVKDHDSLIHKQLLGVVDYLRNYRNSILGNVSLVVSLVASVLTVFFYYQMWETHNLANTLMAIAFGVTTFEVLYILFVFLTENEEMFREMADALNDFSMTTFLTGKISSWLYAVTHFSIIMFSGYFAQELWGSQTNQLLMTVGYIPVLLVLLAGSYLSIMLVRLVFEYSIALIRVAQNTSK
jgi:hypothetical protein